MKGVLKSNAKFSEHMAHIFRGSINAKVLQSLQIQVKVEPILNNDDTFLIAKFSWTSFTD